MNDSSIRITADNITISRATTEREQFVTDYIHVSDFFGSTTVSRYYSHAEGQNASASGWEAHAEGASTVASSCADAGLLYPQFNYCERYVCPICRRQSVMLCSTRAHFCAFCGHRL